MSTWIQFEKTPEQIRKKNERYELAMRLIRQAQTDNDGEGFLEAFKLIPPDMVEEQHTLRREWILSHIDHNDRPVFGPLEISVPTTNLDKPVYRKDGQIHSFKALPYPGYEGLTANQYQVRTGGQLRGMKHGK